MYHLPDTASRPCAGATERRRVGNSALTGKRRASFIRTGSPRSQGIAPLTRRTFTAGVVLYSERAVRSFIPSVLVSLLPNAGDIHPPAPHGRL